MMLRATSPAPRCGSRRSHRDDRARPTETITPRPRQGVPRLSLVQRLPRAGRSPGTPSAWCVETRTTKSTGSCSPSTPWRLSSTRPSRSGPTCSSRTIRCSCGPSTALPRPRRRAASSTGCSTAGVALHVAHTNADVARPGVSDALADGPRPASTWPLRPVRARRPTYKLVTFVPPGRRRRGHRRAGRRRRRIDRRLRTLRVDHRGHRLVPAGCRGATQRSAASGRSSRSPRSRVEMVLPGRRRVLPSPPCAPRTPTRNRPSTCTSWPRGQASGPGRVGAPQRPDAAARSRPRAATPCRRPLRAPGRRRPRRADTDRRRVRRRRGLPVRRRAGDRRRRYVTADLRHHPASEASSSERRSGAGRRAHWATEWPWLRDAGERLARLPAREAGTTVETRVSQIVTDPWTCRSPPDRGARAERRRPRTSDACLTSRTSTPGWTSWPIAAHAARAGRGRSGSPAPRTSCAT